MSASKEYVEDYNTATMPSKKHSSSIHPSTFYAELSQELPASIHFALGFVGSRHIRHVNGSCVKKKARMKSTESALASIIRAPLGNDPAVSDISNHRTPDRSPESSSL